MSNVAVTEEELNQARGEALDEFGGLAKDDGTQENDGADGLEPGQENFGRVDPETGLPLDPEERRKFEEAQKAGAQPEPAAAEFQRPADVPEGFADWNSTDLNYWRGRVAEMASSQQKIAGKAGELINNLKESEAKNKALEEELAKEKAKAPSIDKSPFETEEFKEYKEADPMSARLHEANYHNMEKLMNAIGNMAPQATQAAPNDAFESLVNLSDTIRPGVGQTMRDSTFLNWIASESRRDGSVAFKASSNNPMDAISLVDHYHQISGTNPAPAPAAAQPAAQNPPPAAPNPAVNTRQAGLGARGLRPEGKTQPPPKTTAEKALENMSIEEAYEAGLNEPMID